MFRRLKAQHSYLIRKSAQGKSNASFHCYWSGKEPVVSASVLHSISSCKNILTTIPLAHKLGICITNLDKLEFNQNKYSTHKMRLLAVLRTQQREGLAVPGETSTALRQTQARAVQR